MTTPHDITFFARTNFRGVRRRFGIRRDDRRFHMYILGRTGMGKSALLATLATSDLYRGEGLALIDPHGDLVHDLERVTPRMRRDDIIFFNLPDPTQAVFFNPLDRVPVARRPLVTANLVDAFKRIWSDSWGVRLEHILRHVLLTLLDQPEATIGDILRIFDDERFRKLAVARTSNHEARRFWSREYDRYPGRFRADALGPIQNKIGAFLSDPVLARKLTTPRSSFGLRATMNAGKVLLVNLGKGQIGEGPASLVGALLVSQIASAGLGRSDEPESARRDFYLYLDEFQTYTTATLSSMLSELRKYRVNLILANQHLSQVDRDVTDAILSNAGTIVSFRLGPSDARFLAQEFSPVFPTADLMNLGRGQIYLRLMIEGTVSKPFSADTFGPRSSS